MVEKESVRMYVTMYLTLLNLKNKITFEGELILNILGLAKKKLIHKDGGGTALLLFFYVA